MIKLEEIKRIPIKLEIHEYLITYEYETWKGHRRKTDKRTVRHINMELAKKEFKKAAGKFRVAFNVQILDVTEIVGKSNQVIDL